MAIEFKTPAQSAKMFWQAMLLCTPQIGEEAVKSHSTVVARWLVPSKVWLDNDRSTESAMNGLQAVTNDVETFQDSLMFKVAFMSRMHDRATGPEAPRQFERRIDMLAHVLGRNKQP